MCDALRRLGYHNGVDIFESMHKWYAWLIKSCFYEGRTQCPKY
jgi:hypothetical protein